MDGRPAERRQAAEGAGGGEREAQAPLCGRHALQSRGSEIDPVDRFPRERRALSSDRSSVRYRSIRLHVLLRLEGHGLNRKKTRRLYREEGLAVRRRKSRRRIAVARTPIPAPEGPNSRWSVDFVHDQLAMGRRFRVLNTIDDVTKECLAAVADTSLSGKRPSGPRRARCRPLDDIVRAGPGPRGKGPRARGADRQARKARRHRQRQR